MTAEEFSAKQSELLNRVPFEVRGALSYMAWERGHAYGYNEVLIVLSNLVSDLEEPLRNLEKRLTNSHP